MTFRVPAWKHRRVEIDGRLGKITGTVGAFLKVQMDDEDQAGLYHPTIGVKYLEKSRKKVKNEAYLLNVKLNDKEQITLAQAAQKAGMSTNQFLARMHQDKVKMTLVHSSFIELADFEAWMLKNSENQAEKGQK